MNTLPIRRLYRNNEVDLYMYQDTVDIVEDITDMSFESVIAKLVENAVNTVEPSVVRKIHTVTDVGSGPREIESTSIILAPCKGAGIEDAYEIAVQVSSAIAKCGVAHKKRQSGNSFDHTELFENIFNSEAS